MLFKKEVTYESVYSPAKITQLLESVTEKYYTNTSSNFKFEGSIKDSNFTILPTFNFGPREQLRPEIKGELTPTSNGTDVKIIYRLPQVMRFLFATVLIINLSIIVVMIAMPNLTNFPLWDKWWILLIGIIVTFLIFRTYFFFKIDKAEKILQRLL